MKKNNKNQIVNIRVESDFKKRVIELARQTNRTISQIAVNQLKKELEDWEQNRV